jgi:hypothetical protein
MPDRGGVDGKANAQKRWASGLGWPKFAVGDKAGPQGELVRPALLRSDGAHRYSRFEARAAMTAYHDPTEREVRDLSHDKGLAFQRRNNMWRKSGPPLSLYDEAGQHWKGYTYGEAWRFLRCYESR